MAFLQPSASDRSVQLIEEFKLQQAVTETTCSKKKNEDYLGVCEVKCREVSQSEGQRCQEIILMYRSYRDGRRLTVTAEMPICSKHRLTTITAAEERWRVQMAASALMVKISIATVIAKYDGQLFTRELSTAFPCSIRLSAFSTLLCDRCWPATPYASNETPSIACPASALPKPLLSAASCLPLRVACPFHRCLGLGSMNRSGTNCPPASWW